MQIPRQMKALLLVTMLAACWAAPAGAAMQRLERIPVGGSDYVRAGEWAEESGLNMVWRKNEGALDLTNAALRIHLETDSHYARKAQIGGVPVWLSLPVIQRGGVPMISLVDVQTTLQPLLAPRQSRARVQTICLDPGHGGSDKGEVAGDSYEKKYNLLLALAVERILKDEGFKVVLTRRTDVFVELSERPVIATKAGADLFVSLHYNSAAGRAHGVEVHCLPPAGMKSSNAGGGAGNEPAYAGNAEDGRNILLAYQVLRFIAGSLPLEVIGVKREHYKVLREVRVPAILVEGGFMTDEEDARRIYDADFRQRMARAIVNGIVAYKKAVEDTAPPGTPARLPDRATPPPGT